MSSVSSNSKISVITTLLRKWKDKLQNGKKIFANHIPDKWLASRLYKKFSKFYNKNFIIQVEYEQKTWRISPKKYKDGK